jgi:lipid A biosynthesis lauroyl/palmitoleoyl acyltransferase
MSTTPTLRATRSRHAVPSPRLRRHHFAPRYWGTWIGIAVLRATALLPLTLARGLGTLLGLLLYAANAKRREIARVNIALCFPELDESKRRRFLRRHYITSGQAYVDLGLLAWGSKRRVLRCARVHGLENYATLARSGRPIILLSPHSVGMNFGGTVVSHHHMTFSMFKPQRNSLINWLLNKGRMRFGAWLVAREQGLRPVVRGLKHGSAFYYLPDEDFGPKHSVFAPFFGVPTATLAILGRLAESANAVVVPCFTRVAPRGYDVYLRPPLEHFPTGDAVADAARMNQVLEEGIRLAPEQYLWTFKLFKTRPAGERSPYPARRRRHGR